LERCGPGTGVCSFQLIIPRNDRSISVTFVMNLTPWSPTKSGTVFYGNASRFIVGLNPPEAPGTAPNQGGKK